MAGMQYICTIVVGGDYSRVVALEKALLDFKTRGIDASLEDAFASNVSIDVYADLARVPQRFSPPPITRKTADAYRDLIQKLGELGYANIEEIRDGRTGLPEISDDAPLFEVVDA